jgi:hypothetical protein
MAAWSVTPPVGQGGEPDSFRFAKNDILIVGDACVLHQRKRHVGRRIAMALQQRRI